MKSGAAAKLESLNGEALFLEEVNAEATVRDLFAEVTVTQRYHNPEPSNIEAVYTFPLPLDAVLLGFEVKIGDRKLAGNVVAKAAAELHYEAAITGGDTAVLLEQAGPGLFTASCWLARRLRSASATPSSCAGTAIAFAWCCRRPSRRAMATRQRSASLITRCRNTASMPKGHSR